MHSRLAGVTTFRPFHWSAGLTQRKGRYALHHTTKVNTILLSYGLSL